MGSGTRIAVARTGLVAVGPWAGWRMKVHDPDRHTAEQWQLSGRSRSAQLDARQVRRLPFGHSRHDRGLGPGESLGPPAPGAFAVRSDGPGAVLGHQTLGIRLLTGLGSDPETTQGRRRLVDLGLTRRRRWDQTLSQHLERKGRVR